MERPLFLVKFQGFYFTKRDATGPRGTRFPSCGTALPYRGADEICRRLRNLGFRDAVVTDRLGCPVVDASDYEEEVSPVVEHLWDGVGA
jgi:hypothetical protein